jgi:hypothetical protein
VSAHVKVLAKKLAVRIYLPASWPNVNTIAAAIELVVMHANVTAEQAAELLFACARERTPRPQYRPPAQWEEREISRVNTVDRFWFEDCRWRAKEAYEEFWRQRQQSPNAGEMTA